MSGARRCNRKLTWEVHWPCRWEPARPSVGRPCIQQCVWNGEGGRGEGLMNTMLTSRVYAHIMSIQRWRWDAYQWVYIQCGTGLVSRSLKWMFYKHGWRAEPSRAGDRVGVSLDIILLYSVVCTHSLPVYNTNLWIGRLLYHWTQLIVVISIVSDDVYHPCQTVQSWRWVYTERRDRWPRWPLTAWRIRVARLTRIRLTRQVRDRWNRLEVHPVSSEWNTHVFVVVAWLDHRIRLCRVPQWKHSLSLGWCYVTRMVY